jgi:hypothetical protein
MPGMAAMAEPEFVPPPLEELDGEPTAIFELVGIFVGSGVAFVVVPHAIAAIDRMPTAAEINASFRLREPSLIAVTFILLLPCLLPAWVYMAIESVTSLFSASSPGCFRAGVRVGFNI